MVIFMLLYTLVGFTGITTMQAGAAIPTVVAPRPTIPRPGPSTPILPALGTPIPPAKKCLICQKLFPGLPPHGTTTVPQVPRPLE